MDEFLLSGFESPDEDEPEEVSPKKTKKDGKAKM